MSSLESKHRKRKDEQLPSDEENVEEEGSQSEEEALEIGDEETDEDEEHPLNGLGEDVGLDEENELSQKSLEAYRAAQEKAGVIYISRIPPAMSPNKVRYLMSAYGEIGRVFLQQEDAKRAYLRQKHTSSKKPHYTEGWVEFKDKKVARYVAEMLNAQPVGGKKGTRFREDVWTMKYLPRFKWYMLTEQIAHEHAAHAAKLRMELSQSKREQKHYLRQVEIGKSMEKRQEKKRKREEEQGVSTAAPVEQRAPKTASRVKESREEKEKSKKRKKEGAPPPPRAGEADRALDTVLGSIF